MEFKVAARRFMDEFGTCRQFHYYVTVDYEESPHFFCENYGVHIMEDSGGEATIRSITPSSTRIDELITLLVEHLVGPTTLADVVADWL